MGILAARAALLTHGRAAGPEGALRWLARERYGLWIVGLVAAGLFADAIFRSLEALHRRQRSLLGWFSPAVRAVAAAALGLTALQVERNIRTRGDSAAFRRLLEWIVAQPWGSGALIAAGALAEIIAMVEIFQGMTGRFQEGFRKRAMGNRRHAWAVRVTRVGLAAHGAVVAVVGWLLFRAGVETKAAGGVDSGAALRDIQRLPYGTGLLVGFAAGLIAYGLSQWTLGIYRRSS
jgi:hypothetical protein